MTLFEKAADYRNRKMREALIALYPDDAPAIAQSWSELSDDERAMWMTLCRLDEATA